ncbi:polysaccharide biosynthesis C-terminal domain-containing protein [Flavobacteriaceae bacterium]|nr:polysaccharide biosynthesis C-terminal domain-containing protein [Flavobacteriaceae bacterium]
MNIKQLIGSTISLSISSLFEKSIGLVLIPLLTTYLSVDSYGELVLVYTYVGLLSLIYYSGLQSSLFRWLSMWNDNLDSFVYEKIVFKLIIFQSFVVYLFSIIILNILEYYSVVLIDSNLFTLVFFSNVLLVPFSIRSISWILDNRTYKNVIFSFLKAILIVSLVYVFIENYPNNRLRPIVEIIVLFIVSFFILKKYLWPIKLKLDYNLYKDYFNILKESYKYGLGVQISQLGMIVIASSDKIMLGSILGNEAVAIYSVGMIGMVLLVVINSFNASYTVKFFKMYEDKVSFNIINIEIVKIIAISFVIALIFKIITFYFKSDIINLISTNNYSKAEDILIFTADILFMYLLFYLFSRIFHAKNIIKKLIKLTLLISILNLFLNLYLIPIYGVFGALVSSVISFTCLAMLVFYSHIKYTNMSNLYSIGIITIILILLSSNLFFI